MKMSDLIKQVDAAYDYGDGIILSCYENKGRPVGDGLAEFVLNEMSNVVTFSEKEFYDKKTVVNKLNQDAIRKALQRASWQLSNVADSV